MARMFGTDGVRGVANKDLSCELALKIGKAGAYVLTNEVHQPRILLGRDTRLSGDMLSAALTAGICSVGGDVIDVGVIPTPAMAYLARAYEADAAVMVSASHNTMEYNGIKWFDGKGLQAVRRAGGRDRKAYKGRYGLRAAYRRECRPRNNAKRAVQEYKEFLKSTARNRFDGLTVMLDCANGAASAIAYDVFTELGAKVYPRADEPDGININNKCGSTHPERLQELVAESDADAGFAFDGDADRVIATDERGNIVDGDRIMGICAKAMKAEGRLKKDTLVVTVMSNIGLKKRMTELGINVAETKVGDRYVLEEMLKEGYSIGGEQSGHVIFLDKNTTGDGMLTAIQVLDVMKSTGRRMSALANDIPIYPQVLVNVIVDNEIKHQAMEDQDLWQRIREVEGKLGSSGRVLVRASGTEPIIRVMLEGQNTDEISDCAIYIVKVLEQKYKGKIRV